MANKLLWFSLSLSIPDSRFHSLCALCVLCVIPLALPTAYYSLLSITCFCSFIRSRCSSMIIETKIGSIGVGIAA